MTSFPDYESRFGKIEEEVGTLRSDMTGLKADVKGLGSILGRIEQGVIRSQEKSEQEKMANRPNLVAVISVLITLISILIGGAWTIGGALARSDERDVQQQRTSDILVNYRNREMDNLRAEVRANRATLDAK